MSSISRCRSCHRKVVETRDMTDVSAFQSASKKTMDNMTEAQMNANKSDDRTDFSAPTFSCNPYNAILMTHTHTPMIKHRNKTFITPTGTVVYVRRKRSNN